MRTIEKMRARERNAYFNYRMSNTYTMRQVYGRWSDAKERAYQYCVDMCKLHNGYELKIIQHNTFSFSVGFLYKDENGREMFAYITKDYDIAAPVNTAA